MPREDQSPPSPQRHVLIVDDDRHILRAVSIRLRSAGYRVSTATDGALGLEQASIEIPDVMVVDLSMPKLTGLELIAELRRKMPEINHPIVLLSASVSDRSRRDLERLGVSHVLEKPFESAALLRMIDNVMERRKARDQFGEDIR
ncbi:MAG: response regulator [Alphaproteobacteria bacterium]